MINDEELKQWLEEEKMATPGEWTNAYHIGTVETADQPDCCEDENCSIVAELNYVGRCCAALMEENNAALIVTMRNNWRRVLEELRILKNPSDGRCMEIGALRACNEDLRKAVTQAQEIIGLLTNDRDAWKQRAERLAAVLDRAQKGLDLAHSCGLPPDDISGRQMWNDSAKIRASTRGALVDYRASIEKVGNHE